MTNLDLKNIAEKLVDTFLHAGKIAKEISQEGVKISIKADKTPVTNGDIAVDKIIRDKITSLTPNIPVISEETVNLKTKNKYSTYWLIDPIDGTKDYIKNKDEYTLNASLIVNLNPVVGLVYAPAKDRLFFSYGKNLAFEISNGERKALSCKKINNEEVADLTLKCLKESVPQEVPGIAFLSGGQSEIQATENLDLINKKNNTKFIMTYSYGRALQQSALKFWSKDIKDIKGTQKIFNHRAKMCSLAAQGKWSKELEIQS